ncbi:MAG TPA: cell division protein FtsA [Hyphomicrobiaceae bacterium]|nr:cell division protein FtsA [Hyphomicrobiaceae bacterium]
MGPGSRTDDVIGLLDIGTSKTVCVVAAVPRWRASDTLRRVGVRVLGAGVHASRGIRSGTVFELQEAEQSVREAVAQAEKRARTPVESVLLAVSCGRLKSSTFVADTSVAGSVVEAKDIERVTEAARKHATRDGRTLLHMNCISYRLDGVPGVGHPLGLAGRTLGAELHAVTADDAPLRNLVHAVERAYLSVSGLVPAPYASALAATTGEERHLGCVSIDIGAGTTSIAAFAQGHVLLNEVLPVGGQHATLDLAQSLSTSVNEAERIKTDHVSLAKLASDARDAIAYVRAGDGPDLPTQTTGRDVRAVVHDRMARILGEVAARLERSNTSRFATRIVLSGGASQQDGLGEMAAGFFARPVRIARLQPIEGLREEFAGPAFATPVGLVQLALDPAAGAHWRQRATETRGYLRRMGQWLREGF